MKKSILVLLISLLINLIIAHNVHAFLEDPEGVMLWVDMPREVSVDEEFSMRLTIKNTHYNDIEIDDIDIARDFTNNFEIISITPKPKSIDDSLDTYTMEYPITLDSDEEVEIVITLRALNQGAYIGDVDVWIGEEFLTRYAQCEVAP